MHRFVAFVWNGKDPFASESAGRMAGQLIGHSPAWNCALKVDGLTVLQQTPARGGLRCYQLPDAAGVILGRLFPVKMDELGDARVEITAETARQFVETRGRALVDSYWGSYVAFLNDAKENSTCIVRDCSGKMPCYETRCNRVSIFFSDVDDVSSISPLKFTVNWRYLTAFVHWSHLQVREAALNEVSEILAGECVTRAGDSESSIFLWDPRDICRNRPSIDDFDEAAEILRSTTYRCVAAWSSVHRRILHKLSGGFDSAVVLGSLMRIANRPEVVALNRYNERVEEDEREFARLAAARAGIRLIERAWHAQDHQMDSRLNHLPRTIKPSVALLFEFLDLPIGCAIAQELDVDAVWTGQGGDHIFFQANTTLTAADYIRAHGLRPRLLEVIHDAARFSRQSYWSVVRDAFSDGGNKSWVPDFLEKSVAPFVNATALAPEDRLSYVAHPWTTDSEDLPKGKRLQILMIAELLNRHSPIPGIDERAQQHHPLLAQPLLDVCLKIPTYQLLKGGRHRALARAAFRNDVPSAITDRESKGSTTSYVMSIFRQSTPFIQELLLEGILVSRGIIDPGILRSYLNGSRVMRAEDFFPLLSSVSAELWARQWSDISVEIAA